jgi:hypothetical protein
LDFGFATGVLFSTFGLLFSVLLGSVGTDEGDGTDASVSALRLSPVPDDSGVGFLSSSLRLTSPAKSCFFFVVLDEEVGGMPKDDDDPVVAGCGGGGPAFT